MNLVISDTSPLNYLILIGKVDLLPKLFDFVIIPPAVVREMKHPKAPALVSQWASNLPPWAVVTAPGSIDNTIGLGQGEVEAISLAVELKITAVLMDDWEGARAASQRGLIPVGTLSLIERMARSGLADFELMIADLQQTNFRIQKDLIEKKRAGLRQPPQP